MSSDRSTLNSRQRRFVELLASGMAAGRAYEEAGFKARGASADTSASRMLRNVEGLRALDELRGRQEADGYLSRESIRRKRFEMAHDAKAPAAVKAKLLSDEAKMMGYDEPERHQLEVEVVIGGQTNEPDQG